MGYLGLVSLMFGLATVYVDRRQKKRGEREPDASWGSWDPGLFGAWCLIAGGISMLIFSSFVWLFEAR
jgi:hypothetical protein